MSSLHFVCSQQHPGGVIEQHTYTGVTELVAQAILVTVVHPLADPEHRQRGRVLCLIWEGGIGTTSQISTTPPTMKLQLETFNTHTYTMK